MTTIALRFPGRGSILEVNLVEGKKFTIGRSSEADLKLSSAPGYVSRKHGELKMVDGELYYEDVSKNGSIIRRDFNSAERTIGIFKGEITPFEIEDLARFILGANNSVCLERNDQIFLGGHSEAQFSGAYGPIIVEAIY
ncbi:MAG: FHA domain-containing protein [Nanoarchaeota archaeon]|nr:FHA domain-containing protein [Nanoarchaeota archaeon]